MALLIPYLKDLSERHKSDKIFEESVFNVLKASDSRTGEKMSPRWIKGIMKVKRNVGLEIKNNS